MEERKGQQEYVSELRKELDILRSLARVRDLRTHEADIAAWEQEMTEEVEQDAIRYMAGERFMERGQR